MNRSFALHFVLAGAFFLSAGRAFGSPAPHQHRVPQTINVNGQQAEGVTVTQNGLVLTFYCPDPQPYTAVDQSSSGWACFDANTGSWLLNAMSPASPNACPNPQQYTAVDQSSSGGACFGANPGSGLLNAMPPASPNVNTKPPHHHAAPYDYYNYAYPDYTYYPEGFFGGRTGHGHGGHDGGYQK
jgi:hypothetical protein